MAENSDQPLDQHPEDPQEAPAVLDEENPPDMFPPVQEVEDIMEHDFGGAVDEIDDFGVNAERPNAAAPIVNVEVDDENPFLLAPDHYLLVPLQKKLLQQLSDYNDRAAESLRQLDKLGQQISLRQEDAGVALHGFEQQLAQAQDRIQQHETRYAELQAAREAIEQEEEQTAASLQQQENDYNALQKAEEAVREQNQRVANDVIAQQSQNSELRSDAIVRKRAVYRGEEQLRALEGLKVSEESAIAATQAQLKRLQDDETYFIQQHAMQAQETAQAEEILDEAEKEIEEIESDIEQLTSHEKATLQAIEKRSIALNNSLAPQLADAESERLSMQRSVASARREAERLAQQISRVSQQVREREALEMALKDRSDALQNVEIAQLLQELQALKAANDAANAKLASVLKQIQQISKEADAVSRETDCQNKALSGIETAILVENAVYAAENRQLFALQTELKNIRNQIAETEREAAKTENEVARRGLDVVVCEEEIDALESALESLKTELQAKDRLISSYEQQIRKNANAIEQRSSAITRLNKKLEEYQKAHPEADNGPLQAMLSNIGKELAGAAKTMKDTQAVWLRAQTDLVMLNEAHRKELDEISEKEAQKDLLDRKLSDLEYEKQAFELKIAAVKRDTEFLHLDIQKMNLQIAQCELEIRQQNENNFDSETATLEGIDELANRLLKLKDDLDTVKNTKVDCAEQLCEVEEQIMLWTRKIQIQYKLMQTIMDQCNQNSGGEISVLENEVHELQNEINLKIKQEKQLINELERGIDIRETMSTSSQTRMKLDSLNKTSQASGATIARDSDMMSKKIEQKRVELDRTRAELEELVERKQQLLAGNVELNAMIEEMRGETEQYV